jgi:hypothetical protein
LFLFIAQFFILLICFAYIEFIYYNNILPDKEVVEEFTQSNCSIIKKELGEKGHVIHRYRANFLVTYAVNNFEYKTWATGNGLDQAYFHDQDQQQGLLDQFDVSVSYPCWYNPNAPQIVVLVLRHDWMSTLPLAVPTIVGLITFYYFMKAILLFFGFISHKTKEIAKKKRKQGK